MSEHPPVEPPDEEAMEREFARSFPVVPPPLELPTEEIPPVLLEVRRAED